MIRSAREEVSAWASVLATIKSTPDRPETIMLLTALPPAPPTPHTMMRGFSSLSSGAFRLIDMLASLRWTPAGADWNACSLSPSPRLKRGPLTPLETLLEPTSDPRRVPAFALMGTRELARDCVIFEARHLRINHQTDRGGESGALAGFRQPFDPERPPDARLAGDDCARELRHPGELACAPGHHQPAAGLGRVSGSAQPVAHELEDLLAPRADDSRELGLRQMAWMIRLVAQPVGGDGLAVVGRRSDAGAVKRLQAFGVADRDVEAARDVPGHMDAAEGDRVDMDQPPAGEYADRGRAAAEIDHRGAELRLVVDQRRQAGGVGRRHHRLDPQVAALDHQHQVARRGRIARREVKIDPEFGPDHALGIVNVAGRVESEGGRKRMQDCSSRLNVRLRRSIENPSNIVLGDGLAEQRRGGDAAARGQ